MRPRQKTDEEILYAAREIFITHGHKASVEMIAQKLGISQPALFKRFQNKKNLLIKALKPSSHIPWYVIVEKGPDERPFREQLSELVREISAFFEQILPAIKVLQMSGISPLELFHNQEEPLPLKSVRLVTQWLEKCCKVGLIREVNYTMIAMNIIGLTHMNIFFRQIPGTQKIDNSDTYFHTSVDLIWNGLKPEANKK